MKVFRYLLVLILLLLGGSALYIALLDGHFQYQSGITIKAPRRFVFNQINQPKKLKKWYPDRNLYQVKTSVKKNGAKPSLAWQDSLNKECKISTIKALHDSIITQKGSFPKKWGRVNYHIFWNFQQGEDSVLVTAKVEGQLTYLAKLAHLLRRKSLSSSKQKAFAIRLQRLEEEVNHQMGAFSIHIDGVKRTRPKSFIAISFSAKNNPQLLYTELQKWSSALRDSLKIYHLAQKGTAFLLLHNTVKKGEAIHVSVALPIMSKSIKEPEFPRNSPLLKGRLPYQRVIKSSLNGDYKNLPKLWKKTIAYIRENHLKRKEEAMPYEIFKVTENDSKNPADWVTELYIPLKEPAIHQASSPSDDD